MSYTFTISTYPRFIHGQDTSVGTTRKQLSPSWRLFRGIIIKALAGNTSGQYVYVGGSGVDSTNGYQLGPGDFVSFEIDDVSKVYVIATAAGQGVCFIGV